jgi:TetR/AcrR family tetracycline transcriptional repressor
MKVNRAIVTRAGLKLLNEVGLEQLTLRLLGRELKIQAATVYWHFKSKDELIDEMATMVLAEGAPNLVPAKESPDWNVWAASFGTGLRRTLLAYRDGARMVAGTRLTNTEYMKTVERITARLVESGFSLRQVVVLLSSIYNYTLSFVMEEQAVFPRPGERSPQYDLAQRSARLDPREFPLLRRSGPILFDKFDRRYKEGLELMLRGAVATPQAVPLARPNLRSCLGIPSAVQHEGH